MKKIGLYFYIISLILSSCGNPTINGKVVDIFDKPIEGVKISIEGTSLETYSNTSGLYHSDYVPGPISLIFRKKGFTPENLQLEIAEKMEFPAKDVMMIEIPHDGLYYINPLKKKYESIKKAEYSKDQKIVDSFIQLRKHHNVFLTEYKVEIIDSLITVIKEKQPRFIMTENYIKHLDRLTPSGSNTYNILTIRHADLHSHKKPISFQCDIYRHKVGLERKFIDKTQFYIYTGTFEPGYYAFYRSGTQGDMIEYNSLQVFKVE